MKIAIDISPLKTGHFLQHRVRGTGFYTKNLMDSLQKYFPDNQYFFLTRGEKKVSDADLLHIPYFEPFFLTLPLKKITKTVVTVHDLTPLVFPHYFPAGVKGLVKWQIQKNSLRHINAVITDSESSKKDIMHFTDMPREKIHVVYLAAGEQFQRIKNHESIKECKRKYHLPEKFALYVGDITWNKNVLRLVQAVKKTKIPLVMVGKAITEKNFDRSNIWNQDRVRIEEIIDEDSKKEKQIHCVGFVPDEELVLLYNAASVFLMPSLYEGFGLPILEAMNCGCPVITTTEGSLPEVAGDAAYSVDGYSVESISSGIKEVFASDTLQKQLSEKGLEQGQKFSWQKTAAETVKVYRTVLNPV